MSRVERLYQCVICGAGWSSKQSLRAHMKVHKGEYMRTSVQVRRGLWEKFNQLCGKHKTTSCHVLDALIDAVVKGESLGVVDLAKLGSPNPIIINMPHVFMGKPRSTWKVGLPDEILHGPSCRVCGSREVKEFQPLGSGLIEGRCLRCGAEWLINPSQKVL